MMFTKIYWISLSTGWRLGISPRPRGGDWLEDEITNWARQGTEVIVSLLERDEIEELDLLGEGEFCPKNGIFFINFAIRDRGVPIYINEYTGMITLLRNLLADGKTVVIHCRQGIGRSSMVAASILAGLGLSADEAFRRIA